jgi:hypothetical protein
MSRELDTLVLGNLLSKALFWDVNVSQSLASVRPSVRPFARPYVLVRFEDVTNNIDNER